MDEIRNLGATKQQEIRHIKHTQSDIDIFS